MRKEIFLKFIFLGIVILLFLFLSRDLLAKEDSFICGVYFTGIGCTHCARTDPAVLEDMLNEYPDFVVIEYEIYQQRENALLLNEYCQNYELPLCVPGGPTPCCGLPLIIFTKSHQEIIAGDKLILKNIRERIEKLKGNPCPLIDRSSQEFEDLNLTILPGQPKIWTRNRILVKTDEEKEWIFGWKGKEAEEKDSKQINSDEALQNLVVTKNILDTINKTYYSSIEPIDIPLSGKYVHFDNAISFRVKTEAETSPREKLALAKVLSLAAVDAINPCALAVLGLMLIAILTYNPHKRKNILLAGLAFVASVFIMYLIYGLIIIKSFQLIQALTTVRLLLYKILGIAAIVLGCFKLRDFFRAKTVCKINPKVNKIISKITSPKGAFLVGAFVTIFLLPCTIGPYIICAGILSPLAVLKLFPLLLLYNLIFILPMLIVVLIIYFGLSKVEDISSWQAKNMKYLDLVAGLIILALGIAMVLGLV